MPVVTVRTLNTLGGTRVYTDREGKEVVAHNLLAPREPVVPTKPATDEHMAEGLKSVPMIGTDGYAVTDAGSDNHPFNAGDIASGKLKARGTLNRSMNDQQARAFVDLAAWRAGLRQGYSR